MRLRALGAAALASLVVLPAAGEARAADVLITYGQAPERAARLAADPARAGRAPPGRRGGAAGDAARGGGGQRPRSVAGHGGRRRFAEPGPTRGAGAVAAVRRPARADRREPRGAPRAGRARRRRGAREARARAGAAHVEPRSGHGRLRLDIVP